MNINFRAETCRKCGQIYNGNEPGSHSPNCLKDKFDAARLVLENERHRAVHSLKTIMGYIEDGTLCRDISRDHEANWILRMMDFVRDLKEAQETLRSLSSQEGQSK